MNGIQSIGAQFNDALASESFASQVGGGVASMAQDPARDALSAIAADYGNQSLKLRLAESNISLTDHSDVGEGRRFDSFADKLADVMGRKAALMLEMRMAMVPSGSWGASNSEEIGKLRGDGGR